MCIRTRLTSARELAAPPNKSIRPNTVGSKYLFIIGSPII
jgi:hypothetical protein